ncbi:baseplate J/gp47 family protein [Clostridium saccharobutylicum]|uniref:Baseplate J family protein n=1 Tax=Clostridium saccharobutylicum DSM 13864 TaxID=1345695 RepID=U5MRX0_CLOSA|nr:baseplate J/gp47 family protein [Clostridium saccharobutylicum]AGX43273.1 baseplate J family protein [Clostridium saccharobutylicum DSM 13864]AQR90573.1 hypothetical protein CLOSC_22940 [Clostridium saccharobutylicum]AQS00477.1 hypothetical protein CSACC_23010 [Clostridium saccharobutylicum]AQS10127.1 hypothetical protein CLOBY_22700 [Clostridium saccharobutylicum]AQS14460.1 hypothetical protein CLOSACC_23010 [Clostridium saccharobutylicum]
MYFKAANQYYKEMTSTLNDVDTSKHSLIYNSLMPTSYEMSYQSMMLDEIVKQVFAKTALENGYGKFFERRCLEQGIERKQVTIATTDSFKIIGIKGSTLPKGAIVGTSLGITYTTDSATTLNDSGVGYCSITATGQGSKYNCSVGGGH